MEENQRGNLSSDRRPRSEKKLLQPLPAQADRVMTVREAAEYLRMSVSTLYHWIQKKKIPVVKLSRSDRLLKSDLDAFILANRRGRVN